MTALNIPYEVTRNVYIDGIKSRRLNKPKIIPFPVNTDKDFCLKYWWLAGWNDLDIELSNGDKDERSINAV